jgi:hypothetical protein
MWRVLDFANLDRALPESKGLFDVSINDLRRQRTELTDEAALEEPIISSPRADFQTSTGEYAAPPDWFSPLNTASPATARHQESIDTTTHTIPPDLTMSGTDTRGDTYQPQWTWGPGDATIAYDPWTQFYDRAGPQSGWWDFGNL